MLGAVEIATTNSDDPIQNCRDTHLDSQVVSPLDVVLHSLSRKHLRSIHSTSGGVQIPVIKKRFGSIGYYYNIRAYTG